VLKITLKGSEIAKADRRIDLWAMIPAVAKNSGLLKKLNDHAQLCCIDSRESWGRDWLPLLEMNLNVGQKGKTSSDSEEVGLAIMDVGGSIFHLR